MRRPIVAANWKMHAPPQGWDASDSPYRTRTEMDIVVLPTFTDIERCAKAGLITGAQCGRSEREGSFTGDVSISALQSLGCHYVLCGHSERRKQHGETDEMIEAQVIAALEANLIPILCVGETADERTHNKTEQVLEKQLALFTQLTVDPSRLIIAYEPIWAIGCGTPATAEEAQEAHAFSRSLLPKDIREDLRIMYGASVTPEYAAELINQEDIDGLLVGKASLDPQAFRGIVEAIQA